MKYQDKAHYFVRLVVALLRGGAWIEIMTLKNTTNGTSVALLRGGAWIEIALRSVAWKRA